MPSAQRADGGPANCAVVMTLSMAQSTHLSSCFHAASETARYARRMDTISGARMSASQLLASESCVVHEIGEAII